MEKVIITELKIEFRAIVEEDTESSESRSFHGSMSEFYLEFDQLPDYLAEPLKNLIQKSAEKYYDINQQ